MRHCILIDLQFYVCVCVCMCMCVAMKGILRTLRRSIKAIANVVMLFVAVFLMFSIMGVQFFSGGFYSCNDANILPYMTVAVWEWLVDWFV